MDGRHQNELPSMKTGKIMDDIPQKNTATPYWNHGANLKD